jgi:hypothetical protein
MPHDRSRVCCAGCIGGRSSCLGSARSKLGHAGGSGEQYHGGGHAPRLRALPALTPVPEVRTHEAGNEKICLFYGFMRFLCAKCNLFCSLRRCELMVSGNGWTEKIALSGSVKPFVVHLRAAEEQAVAHPP